MAIPADVPSNRGRFPKNEGGGGWTGIALVNTQTHPVEVDLSEHGLAGTVIERVSLPFRRVLRSTGRVVAFSINATADRQMMGGMVAIQGDYLR